MSTMQRCCSLQTRSHFRNHCDTSRHIVQVDLYTRKVSQGMKLSFLVNNEFEERYNPVPLIPTAFWSTRIVEIIPMNMFYRKRLMREVFDIEHKDLCTNSNFHVRSESSCVCKICFEHAHPYHSQYCSARNY